VPARIELNHSGRIGACHIIEQQELHPARLPRENAEIDAFGKDSGTQRKAPTRLVIGHLFEAGKVSSRDIARAGRNDTSASVRVQIGRGREPVFTDGGL